MLGVEGRDDDQDLQQGARDPGGSRGQAQAAGAPPGDVGADRGDRCPEVLFHHQQGKGPRGGRAPAFVAQGRDREGEHRDGEADLVEVESHGRSDAPGRPVPYADHQRSGSPVRLVRPAAERYHGHREESRLGQQEGQRRGEDAVERGEGGEDRGEMVTEQLETRALQGGDGCVARRVGAHGLFEDPEVVARGPHPLVQPHRQRRVQGEEPRGEAPRHHRAGGLRASRSQQSLPLPLPLDCLHRRQSSRSRGSFRSSQHR